MKRIRRIVIWGLTAWFLSAGPVAAQSQSAEQAQSLVRETTDAVLSRLESKREALQQNPEELYALIEDIVLPHFDFEAMSRLVLARHWRTASEEQRRQFVEEFRRLLVRTYGTALLEYSGETIDYRPVHAGENADRVSVPTEVVSDQGGPSIPIVYRLHQANGKWLVYDISVDGVSLLLNYRNEYNTVIRREGMDALLARMSGKNGRAPS
ncbi:MlaC/ttg2D family ABC transporter substrate-binding protein [Thiohalomonas denitrificans]|uniref:MlaC/ttg2D family ABC transporter substrate-binding protein n=1 Tax=Thiohalomonas denitrificans TaxID=415747 RepID=UPI0026F1D8DB|nr:ABC transporter substrate-binding protein [Thiohalomonas denitrificans]